MNLPHVPASLSERSETDTADTFQRVQLHNQRWFGYTNCFKSNLISYTLGWQRSIQAMLSSSAKGSMPSTRSPKRYDRLLETTHDSWLRGSTVRCNCSQVLKSWNDDKRKMGSALMWRTMWCWWRDNYLHLLIINHQFLIQGWPMYKDMSLSLSRYQVARLIDMHSVNQLHERTFARHSCYTQWMI